MQDSGAAPEAVNPNEVVVIDAPPNGQASQKSASDAGGVADIFDDTEFMNGDPEAKKLMNSMKKKAGVRVEKENLLNYVEQQEAEKQVFLQLPFTLLYFCSLVVMIFGHESVKMSGLLQREHRSMIMGTTYEGVAFTSGHKDTGDIDTKEDIYTFWNEVMAPMYIGTYGPSDPYRNLRYNQIIGGLQVQQLRRGRTVCSTEYPGLGPFPSEGTANPLTSSFECYPWYTESRDCFGPEDKTLLKGVTGWCPDSKRKLEVDSMPRRRLQEGLNESTEDDLINERRLDYVREAGGTGGESKGAAQSPGREQYYSLYLNEFEGLPRAHEKLAVMQANGWIDFHTAWVGMKFLIFNPDLQMFCYVNVGTFMPPSGIMLTKVSIQSFQPMVFMSTQVVVADIFWVIMLFWFAARVILNLNKAGRNKDIPGWFKNGWNYVDVFCVLGGFMLIVMYLVLYNKLTAVREKAMAVRIGDPGESAKAGETAEVQLAKMLAYEGLLEDMHYEAGELSEMAMTGRIILCWYMIMVAIKFLQSFVAQPKLAVVTNTILQAGTDLFHFMIVFVVLFWAFVISGMFMFGRRMWEFSSYTQACIHLFLMWLGDFDLDSLTEDLPVTGFFWFFLFSVVLVLLLQNMVMAIIMDQYTEVKSAASSSMPMWTQAAELLDDTVRRCIGKRASNADIIEKIRLNVPESDGGDVDKDILLNAVGVHMTPEQASNLIAAVQQVEEDDVASGVSMSNAMKMIGWLKVAVTKITVQLEDFVMDEREDFAAIQAECEQADHNIRNANVERLWDEPEEPAVPVVEKPVADDGMGMTVQDGMFRMDKIDLKMAKIEEFVQEALQYSTFRGNDLRNRLAVIEDLVRSRRDAQWE
jgi:hypothetical protein